MRSMNKDETLSLYRLEKNCPAIIVELTAGNKSSKRLADLGLTPKTEIKVLRKTLFCGPLEIEARGTKIVLGKGLATKILVKKL